MNRGYAACVAAALREGQQRGAAGITRREQRRCGRDPSASANDSGWDGSPHRLRQTYARPEVSEFIRVHIGTCWWCGSAADSREHKFKRTDIERAFGRGPYRDGRTLVKQGYSNRPSEMTGSKSKVFKFEPMICARCNGVRSQPFDAAYDQFMAYLFDNEAAFLGSGDVDLRVVYGREWESKSRDLARYFVKHICCRLANVAEHREIRLDARLIEFLDGGSYPRCLGLALLIDMSVAECWRAMRLLEEEPGDYGSFLHLTGLGGVPAPRPEPIENPEAGMLVGWFAIYWRIADDEYIPNPLAGPIVPFIVTDWHFGTENRMILARISAAIESDDIDPRAKDFAEVTADFGLDGARMLMLLDADDLIRPEPSPLGLTRHSIRR